MRLPRSLKPQIPSSLSVEIKIRAHLSQPLSIVVVETTVFKRYNMSTSRLFPCFRQLDEWILSQITQAIAPVHPSRVIPRHEEGEEEEIGRTRAEDQESLLPSGSSSSPSSSSSSSASTVREKVIFIQLLWMSFWNLVQIFLLCFLLPAISLSSLSNSSCQPSLELFLYYYLFLDLIVLLPGQVILKTLLNYGKKLSVFLPKRIIGWLANGAFLLEPILQFFTFLLIAISSIILLRCDPEEDGDGRELLLPLCLGLVAVVAIKIITFSFIQCCLPNLSQILWSPAFPSPRPCEVREFPFYNSSLLTPLLPSSCSICFSFPTNSLS